MGVTITPNNFSDDGCYRRSLARTNKGAMGVIGINGAPFPLVKISFFVFSPIFEILPNFPELFVFFPKFPNDGC